MRQLIIIGAGALAREVHSVFKDAYSVIGFLDNPFYPDEKINGLKIEPVPPTEPYDSKIHFVIAVGDTLRKQQLAKKYSHLKFTSLVHRTAVVSEYTKLQEGTIVFPFAVVDPNVNLGKHVFLGYHTFVGHHANIDDYPTLFS